MNRRYSVTRPGGRGPRAIEELRVGDCVATAEGGTTFTSGDEEWVRVALEVSDDSLPDHVFHIELLRRPHELCALQVSDNHLNNDVYEVGFGDAGDGVSSAFAGNGLSSAVLSGP